MKARWSALVVAGIITIAGAGPAAAEPVTATDSLDRGLGLDVTRIAHEALSDTVVYRVETSEPFTDRAARFEWGIDKGGDRDFDLTVVAGWRDGALVGAVQDTAGHKILDATVTRPAPNALQVSFPVAVLGGVASYRYELVATAGEEGDLQLDQAPDQGLLQHVVRPPAPAPAHVAPAQALTSPAPAVAGPLDSPDALPRTGSSATRLAALAGLLFVLGGGFYGFGAPRPLPVRVRARRP